MKIVILGAKGMLGSALAKEFADFSPTLWDREEIDATNAIEVRDKIYEIRPQIIINCVAMTDVDACEYHKDLAFTLNAKVVENLAGICNAISATLVQYSTVYVFDGKKQEGYTENFTNTRPISIYGKSKLAGERAAQLAQQHYIIRLDRLFGSPGSGKSSFVEKILKAAETQNEVKAIADEFGSPTYASDLAKLTRTLASNGATYGLYHGANDGRCSWFEWAQEIFKIKDISVPLVQVSAAAFPRKAERPQYGILRNTKLPKQRSWQEALKEYLLNL